LANPVKQFLRRFVAVIRRSLDPVEPSEGVLGNTFSFKAHQAEAILGSSS